MKTKYSVDNKNIEYMNQSEISKCEKLDWNIKKDNQVMEVVGVDAARQGLTRGNWESLTRPRERLSDWILLGPLLLSAAVTISLSPSFRLGFLATMLMTFNRTRGDGPRWLAGRGIRSRLL